MPLPHLTLKWDFFLCALNFSRLYNIPFNSDIFICHTSPIHSVSVTYQKLTYLLGTNYTQPPFVSQAHMGFPWESYSLFGEIQDKHTTRVTWVTIQDCCRTHGVINEQMIIQAAIGVTFRRSLKHTVSLLSPFSTRILNGLSSNSNISKCLGNYDLMTILMHVYVYQFWEALGFLNAFTLKSCVTLHKISQNLALL